MDRDSQYLQMFLDESFEYIQQLNENILELENNPENKEIINSVFRAAHSLKGMAATMGFDSLTKLTHKIENLLDKVRNNKLKVTEDLVDNLFAGFDLIKALVENIKEDGKEDTEIEDYIQALDNISEKDISEADSPKEEPNSRNNQIHIAREDYREVIDNIKETDIIYNISVQLKTDSMLQSVRAFMVLKKAEELGYLVKSSPSRQQIEEEEEITGNIYMILISQMEAENIKNELKDIIDVLDVQIETIEKSELEKDAPDNTQPVNKKSINVSPTVRVDINKLDKLMNMVGELLINKTRLDGLDVDLEIYQDIIQQLDRVTMELHHVVMQIRMVPISGIFNRFPRMVRDLSRDLGKKINVKIRGADTELDRSIIDELADPLVHILRNAVDHGIETPSERKKQGKDATGEILLKAYQKGSEIIIEIADDGAGIDADRIAQLAVERDLVTQEQIMSMDKKEKLNFIFDPGFSTTEQITDVSGRGVGMDVVKSVVKKLDGQVKIDSTPGKGTKFTISLPLTLAITQALMIEVNDESFAIPLNAVSETLTLSPEDIKQVRGQDVIILRDSTIPLISASERLNYGDRVKTYKNRNEI